jgi:hypothetical protein
MGHSYHSAVLSGGYHPIRRISGEKAIEDSSVAIEEQQHVALPKLYGAPAYARPVLVVDHAPRPFDPDDLPIEAVQTEEERELTSTTPAGMVAGGAHSAQDNASRGRPHLRPLPLSLRALAGRILGDDEGGN